MSSRTVRAALSAAFAITAVVLSACGSDDKAATAASAGGGGGSVSSVGGSLGAVATKAGKDAAAKAGAAEKLPTGITVGVVQAVAASEGVQRLTAGAQEAAGILGWKVDVCDGQGLPAKIATCFQSVLDKKVDVVLSIANDPSTINRQLTIAHKRGIQTYNIGGDVPASRLLAGSYSPDDTAMTKLLDQFLVSKMKQDGRTSLAVQSNKAIGALRVRRQQLQQDLAGDPSVKVVAENETDLADPVASVTAAVRTTLTAHPDLGAVWASLDSDVPSIGRNVRAQVKGGKAPLIVGFYGNKDSLDLIRQGVVTGVVESPTEASSWIALDQALESMTRKTTPSSDRFAKSTYATDFLKPLIISKDQHLPTAGKYATPLSDFVSFFKAKWAAEFGTSG
jgi:ABC-type sugar transport system substrate-binding protein